MDYKIRKNCIFCESELDKTFFENDLSNYVAHYAVEMDNNDFISIPYNVCICIKCKTPQNKYLANLDEIYLVNHADSTGNTMRELHNTNLDMILKYKDDINNILEIGSSVGVLADMILDKLDITYNIIEPSYFGNRDNKVIYDGFYENVDDSNIDADTLVISHVFEHFYNPIEILRKISKNKNIKNFFLVFPDLEYYINNNDLHVLNTEHTYYVDNKFLVNILKLHGFDLVEETNYKNHSVIFYFRRNEEKVENVTIDFVNGNYDLNTYFDRISDTVSYFNKVISTNKNTYLWPSSIHTLYLMIFGLNYNDISGLIDNSPLKIGKKMYGINKPVYPFLDKIKDKNSVVLVNGGVFNKEVENILEDNGTTYYVPDYTNVK